jgi:PASTA domain
VRGLRGNSLNIALAAAGGFLAGIVLVAALGGPAAKVRTVTAPAVATAPGTTTTGGRVVASTTVPDIIGDRLDIAKQRIRRAGFVVNQSGGGLLGVIRDHNWQVVAEDPTAGTSLQLGSTVTVDIQRP